LFQHGIDYTDQLVRCGQDSLFIRQSILPSLLVIDPEEITEVDDLRRHQPDDPSQVPVAPLRDPAAPFIFAGLANSRINPCHGNDLMVCVYAVITGHRTCTEHKYIVPILSGNLWFSIAAAIPLTPEEARHAFFMKCEPCAVLAVSIILGHVLPTHIAKVPAQAFCCVSRFTCQCE
jgi:hypothetical protein